MRKLYTFALLSLLFLICNSCSEMFDCIASTKPELESKTLAIGYLSLPYEDYITASVKNTSNDNAFYYYFSVDGELPPGLNYSEEGRDWVFYGSPTQRGTYAFKVTVIIEYPEDYESEDGFWEDSDRICFGNDNISRNYTITIE